MTPAVDGERVRPPHLPVLHHFGTATTRVEEMAEWYRTVVGMEIVVTSDVPVKSAYVTNDTAHHRGGFFHPPFLEEDPDKLKHARIQHLAFEYASLDELLTTWEHLAGLGIDPVKCTDHGTHFAFYYKDPDANSVELMADAYGDWERSMQYIREDPRARSNPPGTEVDPAKLIAARDAGATLLELHDGALAGEFLPATPANPMASF